VFVHASECIGMHLQAQSADEIGAIRDMKVSAAAHKTANTSNQGLKEVTVTSAEFRAVVDNMCFAGPKRRRVQVTTMSAELRAIYGRQPVLRGRVRPQEHAETVRTRPYFVPLSLRQ
jgi:hypothetical protein